MSGSDVMQQARNGCPPPPDGSEMNEKISPHRVAGSMGEYVFSNHDLARLVRNALSWSPFLEGLTFDVAAADGTVMLTGFSPYQSLRHMAEMLACTIPGVRGVINDISLPPSP